MKIPIIIFLMFIASVAFADPDYGNGSYGNQTYGGSNASSPPSISLTVSPKTVPTVATVSINCEAQDSNLVKSLEIRVDNIVECVNNNVVAFSNCSISYLPSSHNDLTKNYTVLCKATNVFDITAEKTDSFYAVKDTGGGGGGGSGGGSAGTSGPAANLSNATSTPPGIIIANDTPPPIEKEEKPVQIEPSAAIVQLNLTDVFERIRAWVDDISVNVQEYMNQAGSSETLQAVSEYLRRATDLPNYSFREKILLIFAILSIMFLLIKPRRGPEHHVHKIMKHIIIGKHDEKKESVEKKFLGKVKFSDGHSEFCYEVPGKNFVCYHGSIDKLAEDVRKSFGTDFKDKLTYDAPHKKLKGAYFVTLTPKERHDMENLILRKKPIHHHVIHKIKHAVKHTVKPKEVKKQVSKPVKKKKKRDKYLDFYKKVRKAKSLKEISDLE